MPIYEYRCENGHTFEVIRTMSEGPVTSCVECGAAVEQVFHPVAVHFKGSGFYTTDYKKKAAAGDAGKDGGKGESKGESGSGESTSSEKSAKESKPDKAAKGSGGGD